MREVFYFIKTVKKRNGALAKTCIDKRFDTINEYEKFVAFVSKDTGSVLPVLHPGNICSLKESIKKMYLLYRKTARYDILQALCKLKIIGNSQPV